MTNLFDNEDLRTELADRMGIDTDVDDFYPLQNPTHDYEVLLWMRTEVKEKYPDTYRRFISYISGQMYDYVVGDYARGAICAIGIINTNNQTTGNE